MNVDVLKKNTIYGEGMSENHPSVGMFWTALKSFTRDDRARYLRFVWGRSRLPVSTADWSRKHKINLLDRDPDKYLPIGHTCFFSLDLPPYKNTQICREKLLYAITHCIAIDADETTAARQAAERNVSDVGTSRNDSDSDE